jgi:hypothetical protein
LRHFDEERHQAIGVELRKLVEAGFIKEVFHPTWLANPVLVKRTWEVKDVCRLHYLE